MLTVEQLKALKSSNVLKDRIADDYKAASKDEKKKAAELAGLTGATISNVKKRGTASARIVLGIAQALNASPYYFTGASDDKGEYTLDVQNQFLTEHGYEKLAAGKRPYNRKAAPAPKAEKPLKSDKITKAVKTATTKAKATAEKIAKSEKVDKTAKAVKSATKKASEKTKKTIKSAAEKAAPVVEKIAVPKAAASKAKPVNDLSKDDIITLVAALHIRAGLSEEAKMKLDGIKAILLS